ncbi:unnamed protein product [Schistosoma margrebowiei]|uniref:Uncharacterized protein n=1 Tax=Schistosoma margrebowiei TaxID=48269 RepID=A0A3P8AE55_9TREM|nr:unnamed protein product [Schistosoma margrebowiei]
MKRLRRNNKSASRTIGSVFSLKITIYIKRGKE